MTLTSIRFAASLLGCALLACSAGKPGTASRAAREPSAARNTLPASTGKAEAPQPFQNPDLPAEERLDNLLSLLTTEEKIECLSTLPDVPRLGIKGTDHVEGLHGLALGGPGKWGGDDPVPTTTFPQAIGLAQTWDPELLEQVAGVEGREARWAFHVKGRGGLVIRAPNADLGRDPRWGRTEECYGEDAFLAGTLASAFVRGLQGEYPRYWQTAALLKHFLANSNENDRDRTSSDFDDRLFHEYYSAPFRAAVRDGRARAFMAAYNFYNGVPCTIHPVLREVTMSDWGHDGIICTDAGALGNLVRSQKVYADLPTAAAAAVRAGISQFLDKYREPTTEAVRRNLLSQAELDEAVRRNFRVMLRLGLLDPPERVPYTMVDPQVVPWETPEHRALVREVTRKSLVLLKNQGGLLPLDLNKLSSVALIGRYADDVLLDWYSGTPPYTVSPRQGLALYLTEHAGDRVRFQYAADNAQGEAAKIARESDVAIVLVGNHPTGDAGWAKVARPSYGKEAVDRQSLTLEDEELVRLVHDENPRTIVVLVSSFPYAINWTQENVGAILQLTHNSQEQGLALADVLFGEFNPGGRLVQTWPRALEDLPPMLDYDLRHGRTYLYSQKKPLYPFGHGLSYTSFEYSSLTPSAPSLPANGSVKIAVDIKNVGQRAGDEVAQLYVRRPQSKIVRPLQELKAFKRVTVEPGRTQRVDLVLRGESLAHWDGERKAFAVEPGPVEVLVGRSSADIALKTTLTLTE